MSLWSFVVSRNWASSRLRTALSLLGIGLGVAIVVAIYVMDHNTIRSRLLEQDPQRGPVDLEVAPAQPGPAATVRADLQSRAGVQAVATWREGRVAARNGNAALDLQAFGLDPLPGGVFAHYQVMQGRDLGAGAGTEGLPQVLLGEEAARALGVQPGDRIGLGERPQSARTLCVDGVLVTQPEERTRPLFQTDAEVAGILAYHRVGRRNFGHVMVCAHDLLARLAPGAPDLFQVQRVYGADLDRLRTALNTDGYRTVDLRGAMIGEGADERAFRNGIKVLGCLALLLGMFVVFQTLSHGLVARVRQLGLLRCLGVSRRGIVGIFLGDALALGVLGSALGIGGGLLLALLLRYFRVSSLGLWKDWHTFEVPVLPVLWTAALGVLFTLAGASFPLWRARGLPALAVLHSRGLAGPGGEQVDLLKGVNLWLLLLLVGVLPLAYLAMTPLVSEEGYETLIVLAELGGMLLLFGGVLLLAPFLVGWVGRALLWPLGLLWRLPAWLVGKTIARSGGRVAAGVCGLAAVLLALLGLKGLTASLQGEARAFGREALDQHAFLEAHPVTPAEAAALASIPGVARVEPQEGQVTPGFLLGGLQPELAAAAGGALEQDPVAMARYADPKRRTLIVSHRLAAKMGWRVGHLVPLHDRNRNPVAYEVVAVSDRSGFQPDERAWAVTAPRWLRQDFCVPEACVARIALQLQPGANPDAILDQAARLLPGVVRKKTGAWIREYFVRDVTRDFVLFDVLLLLILVLAGVGLMNGMAIAAIGRSRELGVLRALGLGPRALVRAFLLEGGIVGVLAAALAVGLCLPMVRILVAGLNRVAGLRAPAELPWFWIAAVPAIALVVGVLAAVVPALRSLRQDPAEAVRYE